MTGNAAATLNDNFSQTRTVKHLQLNKTKPHYFGRKVKKAKKHYVCYTMPLESKGRRIHYITINNQAQQKKQWKPLIPQVG